MAIAEQASLAPLSGALRRPTFARRVVRFIRRYPLAAFGIVVLALLAMCAIFAPLISPYSYRTPYTGNPLEHPSFSHILGTDNLGRDMLSRIVYGARVSLSVGFLASGIMIVIATFVGVVSGFFGGMLDFVVQRFVDVWMSIPGLVLLISLLIIEPANVLGVATAIGLLLSGGSARLIRSAVFGVRHAQYVEASRAIGASVPRLLFWHILPNIAAIIIVIGSISLGAAILLDASVSFLGYGIAPPTPDWGSMLGGQGRQFMLQAPLLSIWPGLAIALSVYSFNVIGDSVRDMLDPVASRGRGGK